MERQFGQPDSSYAPEESLSPKGSLSSQGETPTSSSSAPSADRLKHFPWQWASLAALVLGCVVGLYIVFRSPPNNGRAEGPYSENAEAKNPPAKLFRGWEKPQVALVLSGQQHGYLQPCGCSSPQYGGLVRRYNFLESLKKKGWPVVGLDVGDVAQKNHSPQDRLKYRYSMKALEMLDCFAVGIGKNEMRMPLLDALAEHTLNNPEPEILAANLINSDTNQVIRTLVKGTSVVKTPNVPTVGVIGLIGPSVYKKVNDPALHFPQNNAKFLQDSLMALQKEKAQLTALLYQGSHEEAELLAKYCAKNFAQLPNLDVILCLSDDPEPPSNPNPVAGTQTRIVRVGHKGRYVGVMGAFPGTKPGQPFDLKYQLVALGPDLETAKGKEAAHPLMQMMEDYAKEVKDGKYILRYPTNLHPVQLKFKEAKFIGSHRCQRCHEKAYKIWKNSGHAHAYQTLVDVKHPSLRNFDGECIVCHVIGFEHPTGYGDALRAGNDFQAKILRDVGCESCHGPGSVHVRNKNNKELHKLMNPWKHMPNPQLAMDLFCQKCHDVDNDVHWNFEKKWPKIIHDSK